MSLKGQATKKLIMRKILETFPGSFLYNDDKEIRINGTEDGALVQIKVTLTAAKEPVGVGDDEALPGGDLDFSEATPAAPKENVIQEPTEDEKARIAKLLESLGM